MSQSEGEQSNGSYQELCAVLPVHSRWIVRRNQGILEGHAPSTVKNEKPHGRTQCLG